MNILDEIDDSFESDYDESTYEQGPKSSFVIIVRKNIYCHVINNPNYL